MEHLDQNEQFHKVFEFYQTDRWTLPDRVYEVPHFQIKDLQQVKKQLNSVKSQLNRFDLAKWSLHTQKRDAAGYVIGMLKKHIRPELLTQAWCKFYEIVSSFPIVKGNSFKSLHLCEAPGAFICALNHYLVLNYPNINWSWRANTLNPDYEGNPTSHMINDDRLIRFTRENWLFGTDLTGDITRFDNHIDIVDRILLDGKVELVTADGSINCMNDPGEQEKLVEYLHYCETMTALAVLESGGSFVLKIFTIFEESTLCLLYLLNCLFNKTVLFKPATSKSGNSELYLVCLGFNDQTYLSSIWDQLTEPYKNGHFNSKVSMFDSFDINAEFKQQILQCCNYFFLIKQCETINANIQFYLNPTKSGDNTIHHHKIEVAKYYLKKYRLKSIRPHYKIIPCLKIKWSSSLCDVNGSGSISLKDLFVETFIKLSFGRKINEVYTSKFANNLEVINNLAKCLDKKEYPLCLYDIVLHVLHNKISIININSFKISPYCKFQQDLLNIINSSFYKGKHIFFINVPFHTQFLAAVWVILASAFEIVFYGCGWCLFYNPLSAKTNLIKEIFSTIEISFNSGGSELVHIFDPNVFFNDLSFVTDILKICNTLQVPDIK